MPVSAGARFPPLLRLRTGQDYQRVFSRAQRAAQGFLVLLLRRQSGPQRPPRLGVMVPNKAVPRAVRRHQIKRWARELFRTRLKAELLGFDLIVLLRSDVPREGARVAQAVQGQAQARKHRASPASAPPATPASRAPALAVPEAGAGPAARPSPGDPLSAADVSGHTAFVREVLHLLPRALRAAPESRGRG